jgi:DNA replication protein DnaC
VLVLDELGFIPFTQTGAQLLFQLCSALYERVAVIITANLRFGEWSTIMGGDERMSAALLDRLTHKATVLEFVGTSYRFRQQLQHQEQPVIEANERRETQAQTEPFFVSSGTLFD